MKNLQKFGRAKEGTWEPQALVALAMTQGEFPFPVGYSPVTPLMSTRLNGYAKISGAGTRVVLCLLQMPV